MILLEGWYLRRWTGIIFENFIPGLQRVRISFVFSSNEFVLLKRISKLRTSLLGELGVRRLDESAYVSTSNAIR